jgi:hypothetical protein
MHWRTPFPPKPVVEKRTLLRELTELFRASFKPQQGEKNQWAMPFSNVPPHLGRPFVGRKRT